MLRLRPEARSDLHQAMAWCEERESGLGAMFLAEADATLERIGAHPNRYANVHGPFRRALMRRFPYAIYFTTEERLVIIFAVLHQRQDRGAIGQRG